jgi:hypothetical protein
VSEDKTYEPTEDELARAEIIHDGQYDETGGTVGIDEDLSGDEAQVIVKTDKIKRLTVNQSVETVTGTFVGVKIDRIG